MSSFLSLRGIVSDCGNLLRVVKVNLANERSLCHSANELTGGEKIAASAPPPRNDKPGDRTA